MDTTLLGSLRLSSVSNSHSYAEILSTLDALQPSAIVMCESHYSGPLGKLLQREFGMAPNYALSSATRVTYVHCTVPGTTVVPYERKAFNQTTCFYKVDQAALEGVDADLRERYIVVSCAVRYKRRRRAHNGECRDLTPRT